jgi:hypothetical protein
MYRYAIRGTAGMVGGETVQKGANPKIVRNNPKGTLNEKREAAKLFLMKKLFCPGGLLMLMCLTVPWLDAPANAGQGDGNGAVQTQMQNVMYHFTESATTHIKTLSGELLPNAGNEFPIFDDKDSFRLRVAYAEIAIAGPDLTTIFNSYVFAKANSPLKGVSMVIENGHLKIKGQLHNVGTIPFETESTVSPTEDGKILLRTAQVKALHIPVKGLLNLFGVEIADLIKNGKIPGVEAREDDLVLDPSKVFPAPHMEGRVTGARIEGNMVVLVFGDKTHAVKAHQAGNYISFHGNRLRFGRLTMTDVDMILIDLDRSDPFDFFIERYKEQIAAGYSKITASSALRIYVKDFNKLNKPGAPVKGAN